MIKLENQCKITRTHTHLFNCPLSGTTLVSRYQKGKTNMDFTEARDSEWQWHQLGHMQVCILLQTDNHASTPPLSFLQAVCPSCHPTMSKHWRQWMQGHYINIFLAAVCILSNFFNCCNIFVNCSSPFLVPAYPGCPGSKAVKWSLLLLLLLLFSIYLSVVI